MTTGGGGRGAGVGGGGAIAIGRLVRLLVVVRFRLLRNLARRRRGRAPALAPLMGLVTSVAYVGLFTQSFGVIVGATDLAGQTAALSLIVGVIVLGTLAARAASGEAVLAGSPENEFWLSRPTSLPALVVARSLAGAVTDPFGALFIFPVLIAAAITWRLGAGAWLVAALSSMIVQIAVSAVAQMIQIAVVRYARPQRRRLVWMALRLVASLTLAALWMTGTWVLRAPRAMAAAMSAAVSSTASGSWSRLEWIIAQAPGAVVVRPLVAALRGRPLAVASALLVLLGVTAAALVLAFAVARRAGMHGWEEAGAPWAEANPLVTSHRRAAHRWRRPLTAATKDMRLIVRDRSQLMALIAVPIIFVGIPIFGSVGWDWSTASLQRVAVLSFSLCLYMATIGPLVHMQAERRAFWILRTVPVSIGRLMFVKARAWALVLGPLAGGSFLVLSAGVAGAAAADRLILALWVAVGAVGMAFIAIALACQAADLSDEQRPAIGPATVYLFLLVGALYNLVLTGQGAERWRVLALYIFVASALWVSGMAQAEDCLDPEAHRLRTVRLGDAALLVLLGELTGRATTAGAALTGAQGTVGVTAGAAVKALVGMAAGIYLWRRRSGPPPRFAFVPAALLAVTVGAGLTLVLALALGLRGAVTVTLPAALVRGPVRGPTPGALLVALPLLLSEELIWRGALQRALQEAWAGRRRGPLGDDLVISVGARLGAAVVTIVIGCVAGGGGPLGILVASHVVASSLRAVTGRTSVAFVARAVVVVALVILPLR